MRVRRLLITCSSILAAMAVAAAAAAAAPAGANGDDRRAAQVAPWVVSLGDSYVSGEAGRWAGNTNPSPAMTDAVGAGAYSDSPTGETVPRCHRSTAAEIYI